MKHHKVPFQGKLRTIREISEITGIKHNTIYSRIVRSNWKITDEIFQKEWHKPRLTADNGRYIADLARDYNVPYRTIQKRYHAGYTSESQLGAKIPNYDKKYGM